MHVQPDKKQADKTASVADPGTENAGIEATRTFVDNRPKAALQLKMQQLADQSADAGRVAQLQGMADAHASQQQPLQPKENKTGLPDQLKTGVENLSGYSMDGVKVHYNSHKPGQLQAHAFAQGTDIHVAPGQQKHLPHEAWHVVQQKQGRVKATTQLKSGQAVNDDTGLEHEADVMGNRALQRQAITPKRASAKTTGGIVQRKIAFTGHDPTDLKGIRNAVNAAIVKHTGLLQKQFPDKFEEIRIELETPRYFKFIFDDMIRSPIEYGEINLENQQHLILFFKDAEKYLMKNYQGQKAKEVKGEGDADEKEALWKKSKDTSPEATFSKRNTFQTAFLGTSASVAYYLMSNKQSLSPEKTIIIGKGSPWNPKDSGGRGIEFVNHPMHMISPQRQQTGLPKDKSGRDETFEGNAAKLAEQVGQTMEGFKKENATITKVSKDKGWYKIETDKGTYYAQKVISGLGIGPHALPRNADAAKISSAEDKNQEKKRVMDLDTFQRMLKDPQSNINQEYRRKGHLFIGVAGPNAGVDAVFEATKLGMYVDWVVTGGPAVVEGMGNKVSRKGLVNLYFDYLNGWTISGNQVKMNMSGKWKDIRQQKEAEETFLHKQPGWLISPDKSASVDYLVYAQGPDVAKIYNVFDKSVTGSLELKYDKQGRISKGTDGESIEVSAKHSIYNVYWEGIFARVKETLKAGTKGNAGDISEVLAAKAKQILEVPEFEPVKVAEPAALGLGSADGSFEFIGGSMIRILTYLDGISGNAIKKQEEVDKSEGMEMSDIKKRVKLRDEIEKLHDQVPEKLRSGKTAQEMNRVLETLSSPTLVSPDQLTPIRSQIEALSNHMPGYVGSGESNLVTDDQTMIAAHLASYYANIPATLANWLTLKIIQDRNKKGVKPGTSEGSKAFVDQWEGKLEELQKLFERANILKLAQ